MHVCVACVRTYLCVCVFPTLSSHVLKIPASPLTPLPSPPDPRRRLDRDLEFRGGKLGSGRGEDGEDRGDHL